MPGDVAERRALAAPLGERARRLALEVDDHPVASPADAFASRRPEGLAEVVVAVRADRLARRARVREHAQLLAHLLAAADDRLEPLVVLRERRRRRARSPRRPSPSAGRAPRPTASRAQNAGSFGSEREHAVHLARHLAEPAQPLEERVGPVADLVERELPAVDPAAARTAGGSRASRRAGRRSTRTSRRAARCSRSRAR